MDRTLRLVHKGHLNGLPAGQVAVRVADERGTRYFLIVLTVSRFWGSGVLLLPLNEVGGTESPLSGFESRGGWRTGGSFIIGGCRGR